MIDNDSGELVPPLRTYADDIPIYDKDLGVVPAWAALIWRGAKLAQHRNDSAGQITEQAELQGKPSGEPKRAPPLAADSLLAVKSAINEAAKVRKVEEMIDAISARLDQFEARKRDEALKRDLADAALRIAEEAADAGDQQLLDSLLPSPKKRVLN
jgi:hypothetical protein